MDSEENFERHFTCSELGKLWHVSPHTVRKWCEHEPGIVRFAASSKLKKGRQRTYASLRVPASVAWRIYNAHVASAGGGKLVG